MPQFGDVDDFLAWFVAQNANYCNPDFSFLIGLQRVTIVLQDDDYELIYA
jgi:hypothetical protein